MPFDLGVSSLLTDEWRRFTKGIAQLDADAWRQYEAAAGRTGLRPGESRTVNIPGWDDIVHVAPRYQPTPAERDEYYAARREHRAPNISPEARASIDRSVSIRDRIRTSAQPEWAQAWGSILTALDNVQDLISSLGTFGRVGLWGLLKWAPFSQLIALEGQLAALEGLTTAEVARRRALILAGRAALPVSARLLGRLVPVVGWVLIASDLMNMLALAGMLASPMYGALCAGGRGFLEAGIPTLLFKRGLKNEIWKSISSNPVGRAARIAARARALAGIPNAYKWLEVAQTTDALFGIGLSLGGIVGLLSEVTAAGLGLGRGEVPDINVRDAGNSWSRLFTSIVGGMGTGEQVQFQRASAVMATAPQLMRVNDFLSTEEHLETLVAYHSAVRIVGPVLRGVEWQPVFTEAMQQRFYPRYAFSDVTAQGIRADGLQLPRPAPFGLRGSPTSLLGWEYVERFEADVREVLPRFLYRHRNDAEGVMAGALVCEAAESLWAMLTDGEESPRWEMSTDGRLLSGLCEDGYLLNVGDGPDKLWPFWNAARAELEERGGTSLPLSVWRELAHRFDVTLIKQLPPEAPFPPTIAQAPAAPAPA